MPTDFRSRLTNQSSVDICGNVSHWLQDFRHVRHLNVSPIGALKNSLASTHSVGSLHDDDRADRLATSSNAVKDDYDIDGERSDKHDYDNDR